SAAPGDGGAIHPCALDHGDLGCCGDADFIAEKLAGEQVHGGGADAVVVLEHAGDRPDAVAKIESRVADTVGHVDAGLPYPGQRQILPDADHGGGAGGLEPTSERGGVVVVLEQQGGEAVTAVLPLAAEIAGDPEMTHPGVVVT